MLLQINKRQWRKTNCYRFRQEKCDVRLVPTRQKTILPISFVPFLFPNFDRLRSFSIQILIPKKKEESLFYSLTWRVAFHITLERPILEKWMRHILKAMIRATVMCENYHEFVLAPTQRQLLFICTKRVSIFLACCCWHQPFSFLSHFTFFVHKLYNQSRGRDWETFKVSTHSSSH